MMELQQLDLGTRPHIFGHQGDVPRLDPRYPHVVGKPFAADRDRCVLSEAQYPEEALGFLLILYDDCDMIEALDHGFPLHAELRLATAGQPVERWRLKTVLSINRC